MINTRQISIIVPTYNEDLAIKDVVLDLMEHFSESEIIVVNDGSIDETAKIINQYDIKIINHENNQGYGAAIKSGIRAATHDIVVTADADGEHSALSIMPLLSKYHRCVMVVGQRVNFKEYHLLRTWGKIFIWFLANSMVGHFIPDINSGLRVFNKNFIQKHLDRLPNTFSFHTTSTLLCLFKNHNINYVPIQTFDRKGLSKVDVFSGIITIIKILEMTFRYRPSRFVCVILVPIGLLFVWILNAKTIQHMPLITKCSLLILSLSVLFILERASKTNINLLKRIVE